MAPEESQSDFKPIADQLPHMEEPPPVRLVAVEEVHLVTPPGLDKELDEIYVELLTFKRAPNDNRLIYIAQNVELHFDVVQPPIERDDYRMLGIELKLPLRDLERILNDREIEYRWEKGLVPGQDAIVLLDPAGNWLRIAQWREVG